MQKWFEMNAGKIAHHYWLVFERRVRAVGLSFHFRNWVLATYVRINGVSNMGRAFMTERFERVIFAPGSMEEESDC